MDTNFKQMYMNTIEMLLDREYTIDKKYLNPTEDELVTNYEENNSKIEFTHEDKLVNIYFFYNKLGVNDIKLLFKKLLKEEINHIILVIKHKLTSYGKKEMTFLGKNMVKEIFFMDNMILNITKHYLVPKHELLTKEETKLFIKKFGKKIPHIKLNDKICRYYNGKIDQIFRIYRQNELYYRIVVL